MIVLTGKMKEISQLLKDAIDAGLGNRPAVEALKIYLARN